MFGDYNMYYSQSQCNETEESIVSIEVSGKRKKKKRVWEVISFASMKPWDNDIDVKRSQGSSNRQSNGRFTFGSIKLYLSELCL